MGTLSDHFSPWFLAVSSLFAASAFTLVLWGGLSTSLASLLSFAVAYGILAGGWSCLWTGFVRPVASTSLPCLDLSQTNIAAEDDPVLATTLFGLLLLSRGVGNILSAPISTSLLRPIPAFAMSGKTGFTEGNGRFASVIVYVGVVFAGAAIIGLFGWAMDKKLSHQSHEPERQVGSSTESAER